MRDNGPFAGIENMYEAANGDERSTVGVQRGNIPLITALEIARAAANITGGETKLGNLLLEAYESGQLRGPQVIEAIRLIEKR